jgi:tripartite-type tricarboxylate transporter receptor subunit TctC
MRHPSIVRGLAASVLAIAAWLPSIASAQYPDKPIRLVVPWPAGGGTDVAARAVAAPLSERLKQPIVIDNRPGANGAIGTDAVARAPKDGYTLLMVVADTHAIGPHVYPKLPYDVRKDFDPVGMAGYFPYALITSPSFSATTVADFVSYAKKNPAKITFASWGVGSSAHVGMEMLKQQAGIFMLHVPFQGAAPAIQAVAGSQVDAMVVPIAVAEPLAKAGRVRMLGLAAPERYAGMPELKTLKEQGIAVDAGTWLGIMAPAGTPPDVLATLTRNLNAALETPSVREGLLKMNIEPSTMSASKFKAFLDGEYDRWGKTVRDAKIKLD